MDHRSSKELKTREDWERMLQSVDTVLFDCDGVLWTGAGDPVAGASDALRFLRSRVRVQVVNYTQVVSVLLQGKKMSFVTNNSSKSRAEYLEKFHKLGMTAYEV
jgi:ribonucleotide monophosphatase NagD (HAD superfamily)